jgi:hypothetical protein
VKKRDSLDCIIKVDSEVYGQSHKMETEIKREVVDFKDLPSQLEKDAERNRIKAESKVELDVNCNQLLHDGK